MSSGFNGMPNIKMEDGGMGSIGLKVRTHLIYSTFPRRLYGNDMTTPTLTSLNLLETTRKLTKNYELS